MDNLTHSLTGLMLSRAGLNRLHTKASWILVLAANVPDTDVVSAIGGASVYFQHHRWLTHALVMMPLMALLPVLVVGFLSRKKPFAWFRGYLLSLIGVASHLLLDFTNPYGIRLFLPVNDSWPRLDCTSVVDVWIWTVLLLATLWPLLSGLVGSEIGARTKPGRALALFALISIALYDTGRYFLMRRAVDMQVSRMYNGQAARRATAFPTHWNPMIWNGVVETDSYWIVQTVNLAQDMEPGEGHVLYKPENTPAIEVARRTPLFDTFLKFSSAPHWRSTPSPEKENATVVECTDLRFGFVVSAVVDASGRVLDTSFRFQ